MKPDIIIKSFNRPFYLERSLISIYENVANFNLIYILDDGTPVGYLEKILEKFPEVILKKSQNAKKKSQKIIENKNIDGFEIPSTLWIDTVKNASDFVLVIEDDVWFTDKIDLDVITNEMENYEVHLVKLGWQGSTKFLYNFQEKEIGKNLISQFSSKIFTSSRNVINLLLNNKFKIFSLFCRLGITNNQTPREYYTYLSILMGLYRKDFWLFVWQDSKGRAKEMDLLKNSVAWVHKNKKNKNTIARVKNEVLKTTYQSSATTSYHRYPVDFDVMGFNRILNNAWLKNHLDSMENYPKDFSWNYLASFLPEGHQEDLSKNRYHAWCEEFKKQYRMSGADTE